MKTASQIASALWSEFLGPGRDWGVWYKVLFVVFRVGLAFFTLPMVFIAVMAGDSGTKEAMRTAAALMFIMSLNFWSALLWSWRCLAAMVTSLLCLFLVWGDSGVRLRPWKLTLMIAISVEAWAAPVRKTYHFLLWCLEDGASAGQQQSYDVEMNRGYEKLNNLLG